MNTLLVCDESEVSKSIAKAVLEIGSCTEVSLNQVPKHKPSKFDSIIVSSHQFAYDKDMDNDELLSWYQTDLIQFSNFLEKADKFLPNGGKIIVILSMDYINGSFASKHYNAIHAARTSFIQSYGNTLAKSGISINGIALGCTGDSNR